VTGCDECACIWIDGQPLFGGRECDRPMTLVTVRLTSAIDPSDYNSYLRFQELFRVDVASIVGTSVDNVVFFAMDINYIDLQFAYLGDPATNTDPDTQAAVFTAAFNDVNSILYLGEATSLLDKANGYIVLPAPSNSSCRDMTPPVNGTAGTCADPVNIGATCQMQCYQGFKVAPGYTLQRICQANGTLSSINGFCIATSPANCDFICEVRNLNLVYILVIIGCGLFSIGLCLYCCIRQKKEQIAFVSRWKEDRIQMEELNREGSARPQNVAVEGEGQWEIEPVEGEVNPHRF